MEAYKVSATLDLRDLVGPRLAKLIKDMERLEQVTTSAKRRLRDFGAEVAGLRQAGGVIRAMQRDMLLAEQNLARMGTGFKAFNASNMTSGVKGVHGELQRAQAAAAALSAEIGGIGVQVPELRSAASAIGRMERNLGGAARNANNLVAHLHGVSNALRGMPSVPNIPRGGWAGGRVGTAGSGGGLHGGNIHLGSHGVGVGAMGFAAGPAIGAAAIGGYLGLHAIKAGADEAGEYQREQALFSMFGMSSEQNAEAKRFAQSMKIPGASMIDSMRYVMEAQGVFRESGMQGDAALDAAKIVAPVLAKLKYASHLTGSEFSTAQELDFTRSVEMMGGLTSPQRMRELADAAFKLLITSGGNVDPSQLRQAIRTGGTSVKGLSADALFGYAEPLMGEMKGGPFGTAMATAFGRMNGLVKLPNQALHEMMRIGLWDKDAIVLNKNGGLDHVKDGRNPLLHADEYSSNPFEFYDKYVRKAYDKMGLTQDQRYRENALLYGRTGSTLFNLVDQQMPTLRRSVDAFHQAKPLDAGVSAFQDTYGGHTKEFEAAWSNFKVAFGDSVLPGVIEVLKVGTAFFQRAAGFSADQARGIAGVQQAQGFFGKVGAAWSWANGNDGKPDAPNPVAPASTTSTNLNINLIADGRKIADVVVPHISRGLGPRMAGTQYDFGLGLPAVSTK